MMRLYIAGSSSEYDTASHWAGRAENIGIIVVSTWHDFVHLETANPSDVDWSRAIARQCIAELELADTLWLLLPDLPVVSLGAFFEFGWAHAAGMDIVVSGPDHRRSVFTSMADAAAHTHQHALEALEVMSRKGWRP